jgi:LysM repeat protein
MPRMTRRSVLVASGAVLLAGCLREPPAVPPPVVDTTPDLPPTVGSDGLWYTVEQGDTLSALSRRSGLPLLTIVEANRLDSNLLRPGQRLMLPGIASIAPRTAVAARPAGAGAGAPDDDGPEPYKLVPRSAWTDKPVGSNNVLLGQVNRITVHHTDEHGPMAALPDTEVIRRIERYHREDRKWAAIGYHYLVGKSGIIYEGRPIRYQGAHTSQNNSNNLGVSMIGDYSKNPPNAKQARALAAFLDDCRARYHLPKSKIFGHRELRATLCPGDALFAWLKNYRSA